PRHTSPVAPSPCSSNNTGPPSPPCWTRNRSLIGRRGGPRHGPPHPPTPGRAPAKPWRAPTATKDGSSADVGGPDMAPHTPDPRTRPGKAVARLDVDTGWLIGAILWPPS